MNLLQLVQAICGELGITQPNAVATSTDPQFIQVYALLNKVGRNLVRDWEWQKLNKEYRFSTNIITLTGTLTSGSAVVTGLSSTTGIAADTFMVTGNGIPSDCYVVSVDSATQVTLDQPSTNTGTVPVVFTQTKYPLPSDWDRQINRTQWDKTNHWELIGPKSAQEWQYLKGGIVATGPRMRYRILGNTFQIWPPDTTVSRLGFEYISKNWVLGINGTYKSQFSADDDTALFSDDLLISGAKYEFFQIKGFDVTKLSLDYDLELGKEKDADKGAPTLSMSQNRAPMFISPGSIPDSGYGS